MRLYALLEGNAETELEDREITGITNDSRNVEEGYLFVPAAVFGSVPADKGCGNAGKRCSSRGC